MMVQHMTMLLLNLVTQPMFLLASKGVVPFHGGVFFSWLRHLGPPL